MKNIIRICGTRGRSYVFPFFSNPGSWRWLWPQLWRSCNHHLEINLKSSIYGPILKQPRGILLAQHSLQSVLNAIAFMSASKCINIYRNTAVCVRAHFRCICGVVDPSDVSIQMRRTPSLEQHMYVLKYFCRSEYIREAKQGEAIAIGVQDNNPLCRSAPLARSRISLSNIKCQHKMTSIYTRW